MTAIAGSIAVEVVADLGQLESGLKRADATAARAGQSMANSLSRVERVAANTNTATGRLAQSYIAMGAAAGTATTATGRLAAANENAARSMNVAATAAAGLAAAVAAIAVGKIIELGASIAKVGMEMQALERGFAASAGSAQQGAREMNFVRDQADRLGLALGETAKQYMQMVAASQGTALQGQATRDAFIGIVTAMTALGKGSEETGRALTAVQQMMSKGKVASEELKGQLGEVLPGAFNLAAQAMGKTTTEFSKMLDDGDVLASDLLPKLAAKLKEMYGAAAGQGSEGLAANLNRLRTAWTDYANEVASGGLNEALNRATQALTRFVQAADGAKLGQAAGNGIDWLVSQLERVPRGFENLGIGIAIVRDLAREFAAWWSALAPASDAMTNVGEVSIEAAAAASESWRSGINTVIGVSVAGVQMIGAAFEALPSVMGEIAINAANALVKGIEAGVNAAIDLVNKLIMQVKGALAVLPGDMGASLQRINEVKFDGLTNSFSGASEKILGDLKAIGDKASSTDYLGAVGEAGKGALDNLRGRFKAYRDDMDAASREQTKFNSILKKTQDQQAQAGTSAKKLAEATKDGAGGAKDAASAYDNLIQRTKDRIEELELEAQYASKTATEVIKLKLAHDLERAAKKEGKEVTQQMRDEWDKLGGALAKATQNAEASRKAQTELKKAQEALGETFSSFIENVLTSTDGLNGALKSLGKSMLSASLDALISGRGPFAGITGLASNDNSKAGGLMGLLAGGNLRPLTDAVAKGTAKGSAEGFESGFHRARSAANDNGGLLGSFGINGKDLAGGLTAIAGLAGSYGSGMAAGSYAQAGIGGALSGGMAGLSLAGTSIGASLGGASVLGPVGAAIGIGLAIYGQQQARKQAKKEQRRQAYEAYQEAVPQIAQFGAQLRGDPQGTLAQRFEEARASTQKLGDIAVVAGRPDEAVKLFSDLATFRTRVTDEFRASFGGMLTAFTDGTGPNSPFAAARDSVKSLGDQLKVFVDDTKTVYGDSAPEVERAREAVRAHALSVLDGAREMSVVATRMEEIRGAGAGLRQVLTDLGMSAADAARAVEAGTVAALARLKTSFEDDLGRRTNSALDKGYLNDAADLIKELASLRTDAAALGTDQGLVTDYFRAQAQSIVDGAELTGEAFADLIRRFPALNGYVSEFAEKIDAAAKAAEIAARRLGYQDRLFAALNDTTTLEGQLAAYDRQAMRDREAEIKAGGEAIIDLEMAQAAERFNIIRDFNQKAIDDQKRAAEEAQNFFDTFSRNLKQFVDNMRSGADTPLSPEARLAAAQSQYNAQLALAQSGNRDAINGLTGYADALLDAGRAFYGSSAAFQSIFSQIEAQLTALPTQVSAEQFIVNAVNDSKNATVAALATMQTALANSFQTSAATGSAGAIASALSVYFNALDANTDNLLSSAEYFAGLGPLATSAEQSAARAIFNSIDADGDGQLSRLELIRASTQEGVAKTDYTNALLAQSQAIEAQTKDIIAATRDLQGAANSILATQSGILSTQTALLDQIRALNNTSTGTLAALNNQFSLNAALNIGGVGLENNMVTALNKIVYNTAGTWSAVAKSAVPAAYATGGWISGPGTGTSDSILLRASNGEFMVNAEAAARHGALLEAINGGADVMRATPMVALPGEPMAPANSNSSAAEIRMLREELRAVRAELAGIKRAVVAGAEHVREGVDQGTAAQRDSSRELKFRKRA